MPPGQCRGPCPRPPAPRDPAAPGPGPRRGAAAAGRHRRSPTSHAPPSTLTSRVHAEASREPLDQAAPGAAPRCSSTARTTASRRRSTGLGSSVGAHPRRQPGRGSPTERSGIEVGGQVVEVVNTGARTVSSPAVKRCAKSSSAYRRAAAAHRVPARQPRYRGAAHPRASGSMARDDHLVLVGEDQGARATSMRSDGGAAPSGDRVGGDSRMSSTSALPVARWRMPKTSPYCTGRPKGHPVPSGPAAQRVEMAEQRGERRVAHPVGVDRCAPRAGRPR